MTTRTCTSPVSRIVRNGSRIWLPAAVMLACAAAIAGEVAVSPAEGPEQAGMVEIRTLAPDIVLDIRYAGSDNFTGRPVPGYEAGKCYLLRPAAEALARVQQALRTQGYSLQVFDCYRPVRAVQAFVAWVDEADDPAARQRYYPRLAKSELLGGGYIAATSGHSRGATVDLGLLDCRSGGCVALDMGTGFDHFDPLAHTDADAIDARQRGNRRQLVQAMAAQGFANYPQEWWHYTLKPEPDPLTAYGFPVR